MYRLRKWLGIAALIFAVNHWLCVKAPKWAVGWGWLERPLHGPRVPVDHTVEALLRTQRGRADTLSEWTFYAAVILIEFAYWSQPIG